MPLALGGGACWLSLSWLSLDGLPGVGDPFSGGSQPQLFWDDGEGSQCCTYLVHLFLFPETFLKLGADRDEIKVYSNKPSLLVRFPLDLKTQMKTAPGCSRNFVLWKLC